MVFCTYCGQSFTRDEHLERHILTHTNVKPFKCFTCHMSFARRDLLQRHYQVHGRDQNNQEGLPPSNGIIPKSAGRTPIACNNCAKTKTKCDKKFPCSRCASRNLRCTLRPTRRQSKNATRASADGQVNGNTSSGEASANATPSGSTGSSPQPQPQPLVQATPHVQTDFIPTSRPSPDARPVADGSFFEQSPPIAAAPMLTNVISPLSTPNGFLNQTPMSGYEDFMRTGREAVEQEASPRFVMEWSQMQMPPHFSTVGGRPDLMMAPPMDMNMGGMQDLPMISEMPQGMNMPTVQTPIATPRLEGSLSDLEIGSSAAMFFPQTRQTSISESSTADLAAVIASQDGWNCFRCNPLIPSSSCPKTAKLNLEKLEQTLRNHETWSKWHPTWEEQDATAGEHLAVASLHESTRDKLLAITQSFLHKALDIHREAGNYAPSRGGSPCSTSSNFVLLPPARVLEAFLRSYASSFERYFPMTPKGLLDPNEVMMQCYNDKAASLLVLMMIAQGAMALPSAEARWLTGGLTEACRISLFDLIEKNIIMAGDLTVLHSALLFTVQAAWSGDKWHMDIAMGQRGMYIAMLRHHGMLEPRHAMTPPAHPHGSSDGMWSDWIQQEAKSRLIYSWAMVDQDMSLFHDTAPLFAVTEFGAPMPDADRLWRAKSPAEWSTVFNEVHQFSGGYNSVGSGARPLSLRDLFRQFLADEILSQGIELTPLHLRLLLHPLQSMVNQYCQLLSCFSDSGVTQQRTKTVTAASTRSRLEEVQSLLQRWYDLADRYMKVNPMCAMMEANMVVFHLISLNAVTNFPEIERLARRENFDGTYQQLVWIHKRCLSDVEEAVFHCGQVLRLVRSMPRSVRPPWWAGAIYRASLILWTESLTHNESVTPASGLFPVPGPSFAIDALPADHPLMVRYLTKREGVPTLTKCDGSQIPLDHAYTVLTHCTEIIDEGLPTRFSDGIKSKLQRLARG